LASVFLCSPSVPRLIVPVRCSWPIATGWSCAFLWRPLHSP
jgi:hypothetical protein